MSKFVLILCLLVIVVVLAVSAESSIENNKVLDVFRGSRVKRDIICWKPMVKSCCKHGCSGDGCIGLMCKLCC